MEFLPGVHLIPGIMWSRIYLIEDKSLTLVDSGPPWSTSRVMRYVRAIGRDPSELEQVLITHSHPDHSSSALEISKRTGARILAHAGDTKTHSNEEVSLHYLGVFGSLGAPLPFLRRTPVSQSVEDGQVLPIRDGLRVIHAPGHTPGSVCYLLEGSGVMFSGDTLFSDGKSLSRSVPFFGSNVEDYRRSLQMLAGLEFDSLCGGHGEPLLGGASDKLRELLATRPEPPSWRSYLRGLPRRLYQSRSLRAEDS